MCFCAAMLTAIVLLLCLCFWKPMGFKGNKCKFSFCLLSVRVQSRAEATLCGWCNVKIQLSILPQGSYGSSCLVYFVSLYYMYMWWCVVAFQFQCEHSVQCISNKKQTNYVAKNTHKKTLSLVLVVFTNGEWWVRNGCNYSLLFL